MSGNTPGLPVSDEVDFPLWPCCQDCQQRRECPFVYDQLLQNAACQSRASARCLTEAADRLREAAARSDDVPQLLNADQSLEYALSCAIHSETAMVNRLWTDAEHRCP